MKVFLLLLSTRDRRSVKIVVVKKNKKRETTELTASDVGDFLYTNY